jgi:peroxiredoxin
MLLRQQNVCLNIGDEAPGFSLMSHRGKAVSLRDFRKKQNVLVVLHPGELDEVCKGYLHFYKDHLSDFSALETQVVAINMDTFQKNMDWVDEVGELGFPLLSDSIPLGDVTLKYDCFVPEEGYGKRAIFLVDKNGTIRHIEVLSGMDNACPDLNRLLDTIRRLSH